MEVQNTITQSTSIEMEGFKKNELSYQGPFGNAMSDSLLTMANIFLQDFFENEPIKKVKGIFSAFVELSQNIAEYYEKRFTILPVCIIQLNVEENFVKIKTSNRLEDADLGLIENIFSRISSLEGEELNKANKEAILNGESLGLLMIKKMDDAQLNWEINRDANSIPYLSIDLKISYGATNN